MDDTLSPRFVQCFSERINMRGMVLCFALALLCGCTARYQVKNIAGTEVSSRLDRQKPVYVTIPEDGAYASQRYAGSGQTVAQAVAAAFSRAAARVHVADRSMTKEQTVASAIKLEAGYIVVPVIAQWEQRATEWSARPSRITLRLTVIDVVSGHEVTATSIEGRSRIVSLTSTS
ncbi:MAG TPA: DUF4823 domain-containing protein, partial [Burkholderiales bacterium]|nr:DUF4823 domain-containing protein [Burkholderiales bacterium]